MNLDQLRKAIEDDAPTAELQYTIAYWEWADSLHTPTADDRAYPDQTPPARADFSEPPVLSNHTLWLGHQVVLSPGQRALLRERFEMTPTPTLIVVGVEHFPSPDTQLIRAVTLESAMHSAEKGRRAIVKLARITDFGAFLRAAKDREVVVHRESDAAPKASTNKPKTNKPSKTVQQLEDEYLG